MRTGQALFIVGACVMVIGEVYGLITLIISWTQTILSAGVAMTLIMGPLWQGGL